MSIAPLGEGHYFKLDNKGVLSRTDERKERSNIFHVADHVAKGLERGTLTQKLSHRDLVQLKDRFEERCSRLSFFQRIFSSTLTKTRTEEISQQLQQAIAALEPEEIRSTHETAILARSYFQIKQPLGEGQSVSLQRTFTKAERSHIIDVVQCVFADKGEKVQNLTFSELLHLKRSFDNRYAHTNFLARFFARIIHHDRDSELHDKIERALTERLGKKEGVGKREFLDILRGHIEHHPSFRALSHSVREHLCVFVQARIPKEKRAEFLHDLHENGPARLYDLCFSCLEVDKKVQKALAQPEALAAYGLQDDMFVKRQSKEVQHLVHFLRQEACRPEDIALEMNHHKARFLELSQKKELSPDETMERNLLSLLRAKNYFLSRKVTREVSFADQWARTIGSSFDKENTPGLSEALIKVLNGYSPTKGRVPEFIVADIPHFIARKGSSFFVIVQNSYETEEKDPPKIIRHICTPPFFVYKLVGGPGGKLSPYNPKEMSARLFLAPHITESDPLTAHSLLSPESTIPHFLELKSKARKSETRQEAQKQIDEEVGYCLSFAQREFESPDAKMVQLRALCAAYFLKADPTLADRVKELMDEIGLKTQTRVLLGGNEHEVLRMLLEEEEGSEQFLMAHAESMREVFPKAATPPLVAEETSLPVPSGVVTTSPPLPSPAEVEETPPFSPPVGEAAPEGEALSPPTPVTPPVVFSVENLQRQLDEKLDEVRSHVYSLLQPEQRTPAALESLMHHTEGLSDKCRAALQEYERKQKAKERIHQMIGGLFVPTPGADGKVPLTPPEHIVQSFQQLIQNCMQSVFEEKLMNSIDASYTHITGGLESLTFSTKNQIEPILKETQEKLRTARAHLHEATGRLMGRLLSMRHEEASNLPLPALETLYVLYAQHNLESLEQWGIEISEENREILEEHIHSVLDNTQEVQKAQRVIDKIRDIPKAADEDAFKEVQGDALVQSTGMREYESSENRTFQLFEVLNNIYMFKEQVQNIDLLNQMKEGIPGHYKNVILQQLMGSGKSFVLIPLLALARADGDNISIAMMPDALLKTNLEDLQARLGEGFHQLVIEQPEITSDMSVEELQALERLVRTVRDRRGILLFSPEKMHILLNTFTSLFEAPEAKRVRDQLKTIDQRIAKVRAEEPESRKILDLEEQKKRINEQFLTKSETRELAQKLQAVSSLLKLFKEKGAVLGDEVDDLLKTSLQYIISVGEESQISVEDSQLVGELVFFIREKAPEWNVGLDFLRLSGEQSPYLSKDDYDAKMVQELADKATELLEHQLIALISKEQAQASLEEGAPPSKAYEQAQEALECIQDGQSKQKILTYLTRRRGDVDKAGSEAIDAFIDDLPEVLRDKVRSTRKTILQVLHSTLNSHCNEEYGILDTQTTPWAIPFIGPDSPAQTQFSTPQELIARTIQAYIKRGVPSAYLQKLFQDDGKTVAANQQEVKDRKIAQGFRAFLHDRCLPEMVAKLTEEKRREYEALLAPTEEERIQKQKQFISELSSEELQVLMKAVSEKLQTDPESLRAFMEKFIYPQVTEHLESITSNSQKLFSAFRSFSGITGTFWNVTTMPTFDVPKPDSRTVGESFMRLLEKTEGPSPQISVEYYGKKSEHLQKLKEQIAATNDCYALIDGGGWLRDDQTQAFAEDILRNREDLDYVIFYDQSKKRMVLERGPVVAGELTFKPLYPATEEFEKKRVDLQKKRFTIYGQQYTVGVDIPQDKMAKAIMTIGPRMIQRDFLQGIFRMRKIQKNQGAILAYDDEAKAALCSMLGKPSEYQPTFTDWTGFFVAQEAVMRVDQNQQSTRERMDCLLEDKGRSRLMDQIAESDFVPALLLYERGRKFFVTDKQDKTEHIPTTISQEEKLKKDIAAKLKKFSPFEIEGLRVTERDLMGLVRLHELSRETDSVDKDPLALQQELERESALPMEQRQQRHVEQAVHGLDLRLQQRVQGEIRDLREKVDHLTEEGSTREEVARLQNEVSVKMNALAAVNHLFLRLSATDKAKAIREIQDGARTDQTLLQIVEKSIEKGEKLGLTEEAIEYLKEYSQTYEKLCQLEGRALHEQLDADVSRVHAKRTDVKEQLVRLKQELGAAPSKEKRDATRKELALLEEKYEEDARLTETLLSEVKGYRQDVDQGCTEAHSLLEQAEQQLHGVSTEQERQEARALLEQAKGLVGTYSAARHAFDVANAVLEEVRTLGFHDLAQQAQPQVSHTFATRGGKNEQRRILEALRRECLDKLPTLSLESLRATVDALKVKDSLQLAKTFREALAKREALLVVVEEERVALDQSREFARDRRSLEEIGNALKGALSEQRVTELSNRLKNIQKRRVDNRTLKDQHLQNIRGLEERLAAGEEIGVRDILNRAKREEKRLDASELESDLRSAEELHSQYGALSNVEEFLHDKTAAPWAGFVHQARALKAKLDKGQAVSLEIIRDLQQKSELLEARIQQAQREKAEARALAHEPLGRLRNIAKKTDLYVTYETALGKCEQLKAAMEQVIDESPLDAEGFKKQADRLETLRADFAKARTDVEAAKANYLSQAATKQREIFRKAQEQQAYNQASLLGRVAHHIAKATGSVTGIVSHVLGLGAEEQAQAVDEAFMSDAQKDILSLTDLSVLRNLASEDLSETLVQQIAKRIELLEALSLEGAPQGAQELLTEEHDALFAQMTDGQAVASEHFRGLCQAFQTRKEAVFSYVTKRADLKKALQGSMQGASSTSCQKAMGTTLLRIVEESLGARHTLDDIQRAQQTLVQVEEEKEVLFAAAREADQMHQSVVGLAKEAKEQADLFLAHFDRIKADARSIREEMEQLRAELKEVEDGVALNQAREQLSTLSVNDTRKMKEVFAFCARASEGLKGAQLVSKKQQLQNMLSSWWHKQCEGFPSFACIQARDKEIRALSLLQVESLVQSLSEGHALMQRMKSEMPKAQEAVQELIGKETLLQQAAARLHLTIKGDLTAQKNLLEDLLHSLTQAEDASHITQALLQLAQNTEVARGLVVGFYNQLKSAIQHENQAVKTGNDALLNGLPTDARFHDVLAAKAEEERLYTEAFSALEGKSSDQIFAHVEAARRAAIDYSNKVKGAIDKLSLKEVMNVLAKEQPSVELKGLLEARKQTCITQERKEFGRHIDSFFGMLDEAEKTEGGVAREIQELREDVSHSDTAETFISLYERLEAKRQRHADYVTAKEAVQTRMEALKASGIEGVSVLCRQVEEALGSRLPQALQQTLDKAQTVQEQHRALDKERQDVGAYKAFSRQGIALRQTHMQALNQRIQTIQEKLNRGETVDGQELTRLHEEQREYQRLERAEDERQFQAQISALDAKAPSALREKHAGMKLVYDRAMSLLRSNQLDIQQDLQLLDSLRAGYESYDTCLSALERRTTFSTALAQEAEKVCRQELKQKLNAMKQRLDSGSPIAFADYAVQASAVEQGCARIEAEAQKTSALQNRMFEELSGTSVSIRYTAAVSRFNALKETLRKMTFSSQSLLQKAEEIVNLRAQMEELQHNIEELVQLHRAAQEADRMVVHARSLPEVTKAEIERLSALVEQMKAASRLETSKMAAIRAEYQEIQDRAAMKQIEKGFTFSATETGEMKRVFAQWVSVYKGLKGDQVVQKHEQLKERLSSWWALQTKGMSSCAFIRALNEQLLSLDTQEFDRLADQVSSGFRLLQRMQQEMPHAQQALQSLAVREKVAQDAAKTLKAALAGGLAAHEAALSTHLSRLSQAATSSDIEQALAQLIANQREAEGVVANHFAELESAISRENQGEKVSNDALAAHFTRFAEVQQAKTEAERRLQIAVTGLQGKSIEQIMSSVEQARAAEKQYTESLQRAIEKLTLGEALAALPAAVGSLKALVERRRDVCIREQRDSFAGRLQTFTSSLSEAARLFVGDLAPLSQGISQAKTVEAFSLLDSQLQAAQQRYQQYLVERQHVVDALRVLRRSSIRGVQELSSKVERLLDKELPSALQARLNQASVLERQQNALQSVRARQGEYKALSEEGKRLASQHEIRLNQTLSALQAKLDGGEFLAEHELAQLESDQTNFRRLEEGADQRQLDADARKISQWKEAQAKRKTASGSLARKAEDACRTELSLQLQHLEEQNKARQMVDFRVFQARADEVQSLFDRFESQARKADALMARQSQDAEVVHLKDEISQLSFSVDTLHETMSKLTALIERLAARFSELEEEERKAVAKRQFMQEASAWFQAQVSPILSTLPQEQAALLQEKWKEFWEERNTGSVSFRDVQKTATILSSFIREAAQHYEALLNAKAHLDTLLATTASSRLRAQRDALQRALSQLEAEMSGQFSTIGKKSTLSSTQVEQLMTQARDIQSVLEHIAFVKQNSPNLAERLETLLEEEGLESELLQDLIRLSNPSLSLEEFHRFVTSGFGNKNQKARQLMNELAGAGKADRRTEQLKAKLQRGFDLFYDKDQQVHGGGAKARLANLHSLLLMLANQPVGVAHSDVNFGKNFSAIMEGLTRDEQDIILEIVNLRWPPGHASDHIIFLRQELQKRKTAG